MENIHVEIDKEYYIPEIKAVAKFTKDGLMFRKYGSIKWVGLENKIGEIGETIQIDYIKED